eukprot:5726503-Pleurochrysis_carterae.AAC.1
MRAFASAGSRFTLSWKAVPSPTTKMSRSDGPLASSAASCDALAVAAALAAALAAASVWAVAVVWAVVWEAACEAAFGAAALVGESKLAG